jgi:uncharacterized membrane protein
VSAAAVDERMDPVEADDAPEAGPPATRMGIALLSLVGLLIAGYLTMYKLGYLGVIQCTIGGCEKVQTSAYSQFLGQPVSLWGMGAYITLLAIAMLGVQPRFARERWVALALFGVSAVGVAFSAYLTYLEAFVIHAWCQWCVISAILITLIFLLSIPGLRQAR